METYPEPFCMSPQIPSPIEVEPIKREEKLLDEVGYVIGISDLNLRN